MNAEFYIRNRKNVLDSMPEGSILLLFSGIAPVRSYDQTMSPFSPDRNFLYLTGIDEQNCALLLAKTRMSVSELLFIEEPDEHTIKWNGKMLTRELANDISGIAAGDVLYNPVLESRIQHYLSRSLAGSVYMSFDRFNYRQPATRSEQCAEWVRSKYPHVRIEASRPLISPLRMIKTADEVECIQEAIDVTIDSLTFMLKNAKAGEYEYQWAADYEYAVARSGHGLGFDTIAASGDNAVMLHYGDNNCVAQDGTLILFDLGAACHHYSADISRTFPVGGRFTPRQKELYDIVLEAQDVAKSRMLPGEPYAELNRSVIEFYKKALKSAKLITSDDEVSKYYYHGVSHHLGLDTHDPCHDDIIRPGMVFTNEPGLYVAEEGIGIRLENDVLITESGHRDLADGLLLGTEAIEALMRG